MNKRLKMKDKKDLSKLLMKRNESYKKTSVCKGLKLRQEYRSSQSNFFFIFSQHAN